MNPLVIYHPDYVLHLTGKNHPENPLRYLTTFKALQEQGLLENKLLATPVPLSELLHCHPLSYIELVKKASSRTLQQGFLNGECELSTGDVRISPESYRLALLASGSGILAIDAIVQNKAHKVFCLIRPPGHHATHDRGMGFCLFNNVAVCARYAQSKYGIKRILIVDWDVHHGNGTQDIFYKDPTVFYFSTHQNGIYPGTGSKEEVGVGNILNCPIEAGEMSRLEVLAAHEIKLDLAMEAFKPELVLVSAGFDAHEKDPLGGFNLKTEDFATLTSIVCRLAEQYSGGRVVSFLEGGYNLESLADSVCAHVRALK